MQCDHLKNQMTYYATIHSLNFIHINFAESLNIFRKYFTANKIENIDEGSYTFFLIY